MNRTEGASRLNRRLFLNGLGRAAAALALTRADLPASDPARRKLSRIGAQLYTVRRELGRDFEGTLARVASLGYSEVEFTNYYGRAPKEVKASLARHGLAAPSAHVDLADLRGRLPEKTEAAHVIGHKYLVLGWLPPEERKGLDDYRRMADLLNRAGQETKKAGVQFAYHNHDFEFAPLDGKAPYDLLLERTDPGLVKLEMDLYWTVKGGANPLDYFGRWPGRFRLLHVKDMDATPGRHFTEVGRGRIDFKPIFARAGRAGVEHYFVEQDETPASPFESLEVSIDYLKRLEF